MYCTNCGAQFAEDSTFCPTCGHAAGGGGVAVGGATAVATKRYGGFWRRVVALLIDALILAIVLGVVLSLANLNSSSNRLGQAIRVAVGLVYFAGLESSVWQATVGKRVLGMRVTDAKETGSPWPVPPAATWPRSCPH